MELILLERVYKLGDIGDIVNVKTGYGRNFLLPLKKALRATKENKAHFEENKAKLEAENIEKRDIATVDAEKLKTISVVMIRQAADDGHLFGSVTSRDIVNAIKEQSVEVSKSCVILDNPIKFIGVHAVKIALHPEVQFTVNVNIARTEDEATQNFKNLENTDSK